MVVVFDWQHVPVESDPNQAQHLVTEIERCTISTGMNGFTVPPLGWFASHFELKGPVN